MSIEQNKKDFEAALCAVKDEMESLEKVMKLSLFEMLEHIINEYETHLLADIEGLMADVDCLEEDLSIADAQVAELLEDVERLETETAGFEGRVVSYGD